MPISEDKSLFFFSFKDNKSKVLYCYCFSLYKKINSLKIIHLLESARKAVSPENK